jgi:hypothetical protein
LVAIASDGIMYFGTNNGAVYEMRAYDVPPAPQPQG